MAEINYFKIRIKRGAGSPGTTLDVGEIGYDTSNNKLYIGNNIGESPNGLTMDSSFNPAVARLDAYNTIQDASILAFELNDVSFDYVDGSIAAAVAYIDTSLNAIDLRIDNVDSSLDLYETKVNLDTSFGLYSITVNLDTSFNAIGVRVDNVDASLDLYETKVNLDTSFGLYLTSANLDTSLNAIDVRVDNVDASLDLYETKVNLDSSFGLYETEVNLDSSLGGIWAELDELDASITAFEANDVTFDYVDGSISAAVVYIDTSLNAIDVRVDNVDTSLNAIDVRVDNVDSSLNAIDVRVDNVDASLDLYETKVNLDSSFGSISIDDLDDVSIGTSIADENILQYKVDTSTWDNTPVEDATDYFALTTDIDTSLNAIDVRIDNVDSSLDLYPTLVNLDTSLNAIDVRIDNVDSSLDLYPTLINVDTSLNAIDLRIDNVDASLDLYETKVNIDASLNEKTNTAYGELYTHDASITVTIPTGASYSLVEGFNKIGSCLNMTCSSTNSTISVDNPGKYSVNGTFSVESETNSVISRLAGFYDEAELDNVHAARKFSVNDVGDFSVSGILDASTAGDFSVRIRHDNGGSVDFIIWYANYNLHRID